MDKVVLDHVRRDLRKLPRHIRDKLLMWAALVEETGIANARRTLGYHDEALKGRRWGQRSIRLSRAYRVIYRKEKAGEVVLILVEEVNKHKY